MARAKKADYKAGDDNESDNAGKKEADDVSRWLLRISSAEQYRRQISQKYRWVRLIEEYRGYFQGLQDVADIYIPSLNLIFAYVKSEIPSLYLRDPKIKVNPKKGSTMLSAKILEKALNYLWRTKRIKRENKKNIQDDLLVGHSWFKTGYTGKFGLAEDGNGQTFEFIEQEDFFGYRVPFENITFNPDSNDPPYDCAWIAHELWVPLEDAKANKAYSHTDELKAMTGPAENEILSPVPDLDRNRADPDMHRVKLYEVWDKRTKTMFVISPGCHYFIQAPKKWPYSMKGFPFSFLRINDDPLGPYGIPDCYMFEEQVLELMKIRASQIDHIKRFNRQLLVAEGHMSDDAKDQFTQGVTGAVIPVRTDGKSINDIITPIPYPTLQTDIYAIEDRIKEDMMNVIGQSATDRGATQKTTTRSLGELNLIQEGGKNRRSDKIDTVEDFIEDIAGNFVALLQQLADVPYFVRVTGEDPEKIIEGLSQRPSAGRQNTVTSPEGFTFTKEDIQGEFDFEVVAGSTTPMNQENKIQLLVQLMELLPKVGAMPGGPVTKYIGGEFADELDLPGLKKAILDEQQAAQAQMEQQQAQAMEQQQMLVAQETADTQIKAEREATKQNDLILKAIDMFHQQNNPPEKKPNV